MIRRLLFLVAVSCLGAATLHDVIGAETFSVAEIERLSKQGKTLPAEAAAEYPLGEQCVRGDTGINVLVDLAHQATFFAMWSLPGQLRRSGFRASGSQAARSP